MPLSSKTRLKAFGFSLKKTPKQYEQEECVMKATAREVMVE